MTDELCKLLDAKIKDTMDRREEILTAFVAKYGCQPDRLRILSQVTTGGYAESFAYLTDEDILKIKERVGACMVLAWCWHGSPLPQRPSTEPKSLSTQTTSRLAA